MSMCTRPVITTITMRDGRTIDRCETCLRPGPPNDDGAWAVAHHVEANDAQVRIDAGLPASRPWPERAV